ncbi:M20 family peptidase [Atopobacter sp. AH10]|uniref:M20 family metallopeptidase n=1 Tax=Atopobacter sp. AH10 TaxID=2315861 RepID=UPI000EF19D33|nr:M20 family metallopeptidase [Atopobacter sp. AH10]RLK62638.1 M20 family peptidase [Atopobacter sp. AH10]
MTNYQETIIQYIDQHLPIYQEIAKDLHDHPETCNQEYRSSKILADQLESQGFTLTRQVPGHETAFDARYISEKPGPTLAFLAEYDALPSIGHACGHNLLGNYSLLAAVALKEVIDQIGGEIRVYGTPGEEGGPNGSSKASFVRHGYFKDVDAALCAHPGYEYGETATGLANDPVDIVFHGVSSHAAAAPELGKSALDALILAFNGINALRLYLPKDVNIHGIITNGGKAANVIPDYTSARFYLRAKNRSTLNEVYQRVENVVKGAALSTGTTHEFGLFQNAVDDIIVTPTFDQVFSSHFDKVGIPKKDIRKDPERFKLGSSDVGNVSQVIPTIQPTISISDDPIPAHSEEFKAAARSQKGLDSIGYAAKLLALTALDLLEDPDLLARIKADHKESLKKGN